LENCERAIKEDGKKGERLALRELANLFGFLKTDEDDNIVSVEPDYDDEENAEWERGRGGGVDGVEGMDESP